MNAIERLKEIEEILSGDKWMIHSTHSEEEMKQAIIGSVQTSQFLLRAFRVMREIVIKSAGSPPFLVAVLTKRGVKVEKGKKAVEALFESRMKDNGREFFGVPVDDF